MSGSPDVESTEPGNRQQSRTIARHACDPCRVRKTRCELNAHSSPSRDPSGSQQPCARTSDAAACRRCTSLGLSCTFLLPLRTRGPRKRNFSGLEKQKETSTSEHVEIVQAPSPRTPRAFDSSASAPGAGSPPNDYDGNGSWRYHSPRQRLDQPHTPGSHHHDLYRSISESQSPNAAFHRQYPSDGLCNRQLFDRILHDYLDIVYPLIPVVHKPLFLKDLSQAKDRFDPDFLGLAVALCATTVGLLPRKFHEYRSSNTPLAFQTRTEMIDRCYDMLLGLRGPDYFDKINQQKWAVSYLMCVAFFQIGQLNRARMIEVEAMQLARLLEFHRIQSYDGLNCIEMQLRKKAFWLMFYGYVHGQLQNIRKERLAFLDEPILRTINLLDLMPAEVDDDMISENTVQPQSELKLSTTSGFNIHSRLFWAALTPLTPRQSSNPDAPYSSVVRAAKPSLQLEHCQDRLQDLKYMLDGCPAELRQWKTYIETEDTSISERREWYNRKAQFEAMRANIHVTHLWLQSIIYDQIDTLPVVGPDREPTRLPSPKSFWNDREDICRQLLHVLHNVPEIYLEPNGHHLTCKVRDVAVSMLACPFPPGSPASIRSQEYLREYTDILSRLDGSERLNTLSLQSWVDTDRQRSQELTNSATNFGQDSPDRVQFPSFHAQQDETEWIVQQSGSSSGGLS